MKRIVILFLIITLFAIPYLAYSSSDIDEIHSKKDPILAGALSWYVPGLGQIYAEAYIKGAVFWVVEESLIVGTIMSFANLKLDITRAFDLGVVIKSKEAPSASDKRTAILLGVSLVTVHFFNVVDAVSTSLRYNRNIEDNYTVKVGYGLDENGFTLGAKVKF